MLTNTSKCFFGLCLLLMVCNGVSASGSLLTGACIPDGTCCAKSCEYCCAGYGHRVFAKCSRIGHGCLICKAMFSKIFSRVMARGACDFEGDALCEAVGLGPEDPLADVCAAAVPFICAAVENAIENKIDITSESACTSAGMCGFNGKKCGPK